MKFHLPLRRAAHIVVLDASRYVLLLRHFTGGLAARHYWRPPVGKLENGETFKQAGIRALREETAIRVSTLDDPIAERHFEKGIPPARYVVEEQFFVVLAEAASVKRKVQARAALPHHWWSPDEMLSTDEPVRPYDLIAMLVLEGWWE